MARLAQSEVQSDLRRIRSDSGDIHRRRAVSVLFIHRDADVADACLEELKKAKFSVRADFVLTIAQCAHQLRSQSYDVVVAEYPSPSCKGPQDFQLLHQTVQEIPLLFLTTAMASESIAQLNADVVFDCVDRQHLAQLPLVVRRVLNERKLRTELEEAGKALRHSQSLYRALVENPAYGICRCDAEGKFLDVNQALVTMLGYETKEDLLAANRASEIVLNLGPGAPLAGRMPETMQIEPVEIEWRRKNGTTLKARLSGHGNFDEHRDFDGYEIIAVDITEQWGACGTTTAPGIQRFADGFGQSSPSFRRVAGGDLPNKAYREGILSSAVGPGWIETDQRPIWAFDGKPGAVPARADPIGLLPVRGQRSAARRGRLCCGPPGDRRGCRHIGSAANL